MIPIVSVMDGRREMNGRLLDGFQHGLVRVGTRNPSVIRKTFDMQTVRTRVTCPQLVRIIITTMMILPNCMQIADSFEQFSEYSVTLALPFSYRGHLQSLTSPIISTRRLCGATDKDTPC